MTSNDNESTSIRIQARAWLIRLRGGEATGQTLSDFEQWRGKSPEHAAAYDREVVDYGSTTTISSSQEFGRDGKWRKPSTRSWLKIGAMAAAAGAVLIFVFAGTPSYDRASEEQRSGSFAFQPYATQRGEIRVLRLSDGSVATLDTDSKVEISITDTQRLLRLAQGRARFEVAAGKQPFAVRAGAVEVVTNSASFDMAFDDRKRVTVRLLAGDAFIRPQAQFASFDMKPEGLRLGTSFAYQADDFTRPAVTDYHPRLNKDWPTGWVAYETIRLDSLIKQANNYAAKPIRLADPMLGSLKVSGRFKISDTDGFVTRICALFDLRAVAEQDGIYLRKP